MNKKRIHIISGDKVVSMEHMLYVLELYTGNVGYLPEYIVLTEQGLESYQRILITRMEKPDFLGIPIITTTQLTEMLNESKNGK